MFLCEKVNGSLIEERFYKNGPDAGTVKENLEYFQWPGKGHWRVGPAEVGPDEEEE